MGSKSRDVRMEQLRTFEKKLALRLQQLEQKGTDREKIRKDPFVKSLESKIRKTRQRIAVIDRYCQRAEALAQRKAQKLAEKAREVEKKAEIEKTAAPPAKEKPSRVKHEDVKPQPGKKEEAVGKEPKKKPEIKEEKPLMEPQTAVERKTARKSTTEAPAGEAVPKKTRKQPAAEDDKGPKKRATKKKEEKDLK